MAEDTDLFLSGIISERADEVARCASACGLKVRERREDNGWTVIRATLR
jgi:ribosomal protein L11 methylase PrmA